MVQAIETIFVGDTSHLQRRIDIVERLHRKYYERERDDVFRRAWIPVGNMYDLPGPNTYVVTTVPTLGAGLLITRDATNTVRAFHNICRHRGNRLVKEGRGCAHRFSCTFHGWTYRNDGALVGVTDRAQFLDLEQKNLSLIPLSTKVWQEHIFVTFDPQPKETLEEWLDVLVYRFDGYFAGRQRVATYDIEVSCNWNLAVNSFTEGYHAAFVHRQTVPNYQGGRENPARHRAYIEVMKRHGCYSVLGNSNRVLSPAEKLAFTYGKPLYPSFPPYSALQGCLPKGLNPSHNDNWCWDVLELFPNCVFIMGAHWHATLWFWPVDVHRTHIRVELFAYRAATFTDHLAHAYFRKIFREVFREDIETMEAVGATLQTGVMKEIVLSQQELILQQHYQAVAEMLSQELHD